MPHWRLFFPLSGKRERVKCTGRVCVCATCVCVLVSVCISFHPPSLLLWGRRRWLEASLDLQHWDALLLWLFAAAAYELSLVKLNYTSSPNSQPDISGRREVHADRQHLLDPLMKAKNPFSPHPFVTGADNARLIWSAAAERASCKSKTNFFFKRREMNSWNWFWFISITNNLKVHISSCFSATLTFNNFLNFIRVACCCCWKYFKG